MSFIKKENIKGDILGGISAGIVTLPVALAYGVATGMGPMAGMYTAVILGFLAAILGGTNTQISSPTGAMTVVVAFIISKEIEIAGSLESAMPVLIIIFVFTGLIQMLLGLFKLGMNIRYVPFTVVSGFMSGIGIIIIILQMHDVFGVYDTKHGSVPEILMNFGYFVTNAHWQTPTLASATVLIIFFFPYVTKRVPSSLVALFIVTVASIIFELDVKRLGEVQVQFAHFDFQYGGAQIFNTEAIMRISFAAISLALLGSINTLLTAVVADKMTATMHNSNKELFGQGVGNLVAGIFGGFPGSGATACTVANIQSGGRNKLSGIVSASFLLIVLLFGTHIVALIPHAVLGAILIHIGFVLIDKHTLRNMSKIPKADNLVMLTVLILTVFWNLLYAVVLGLIFASFYFMKKMADVVETDTQKTKVDKIIEQVINTFEDPADFKSRVLIKTIHGPIFFGFSSRFLISMRNIPSQVEAVIFNMSMVPYMDHSGVRTFIEVVQLLNEKKINVCISELSDGNMKLLIGLQVIPNLVDEAHVFDSVEECIMWMHQPGHIEDKLDDPNLLYIPPAFTPNGDGINDDWNIKNIDNYPEAVVKVSKIHGETVFKSRGYKIPWNGQFKGSLLPPGEYQYSIKLNNENDELFFEGSVFMFR
jgi:SulP family sulfate permease